jgi:hypothetical protein
MTRSIRASEEAKRATICQNDERNEFNQVYCKQKFLRIVHRDKAESRIAQQFRDLRQAFSEFNVKRFRSIFRTQRQD